MLLYYLHTPRRPGTRLAGPRLRGGVELLGVDDCKVLCLLCLYYVLLILTQIVNYLCLYLFHKVLCILFIMFVMFIIV